MSEQSGREAVDAREVVHTADARQPRSGEVLAAADLPISHGGVANLTFASGGSHDAHHGAPRAPSGIGKQVGRTIDFVEGRLYAIPGSIALFGHVLHVGFSEIRKGLHSTHNPLQQLLILFTGTVATFIAAGLMATVNLPAQFFTGHRIDTWKIWSWNPFKGKSK